MKCESHAAASLIPVIIPSYKLSFYQLLIYFGCFNFICCFSWCLHYISLPPNKIFLCLWLEHQIVNIPFPLLCHLLLYFSNTEPFPSQKVIEVIVTFASKRSHPYFSFGTVSVIRLMKLSSVSWGMISETLTSSEYLHESTSIIRSQHSLRQTCTLLLFCVRHCQF